MKGKSFWLIPFPSSFIEINTEFCFSSNFAESKIFPSLAVYLKALFVRFSKARKNSFSSKETKNSSGNWMSYEKFLFNNWESIETRLQNSSKIDFKFFDCKLCRHSVVSNFTKSISSSIRSFSWSALLIIISTDLSRMVISSIIPSEIASA